MVLYIKYMVSLRCKMKVKAELDNLGLSYGDVESGVVEMEKKMPDELRKLLKVKLYKFGMELLDSKSSIMVESIITIITDMVYSSDQLPKVVYADYLSKKLNLDYDEMATIFSEVKGITIPQFIMVSKIEKVKELLLYDELNLKEIANKLNYKNIPLMSSEFKKVTGLSLAFFKGLKQKRQIRPLKKKKLDETL